MNTIIIILLVSVFIIPLFVWKEKYGIQPSISDNFRKLQEEYGKGSLRPWFFWLWLMGVGALFHAYFLNGLSFLTMVLLMLVGAAAEYWKSKHVEIPHIVGATGGILAGYVTVIVHAVQVGHTITGVTGFIIGGLLALIIEKKGGKKRTYWLEVVQFGTIILIVTLIDFVYV